MLMTGKSEIGRSQRNINSCQASLKFGVKTAHYTSILK
jgi:hypothetical protein